MKYPPGRNPDIEVGNFSGRTDQRWKTDPIIVI